MGALSANADSLVTIRPVGTDKTDWWQLGADYQPISNPFAFLTALGVAGLGSWADTGSSYGVYGDAGVVMGQSVSWDGNFSPTESLNWTQNSGALTLTFAQEYDQIGTHIQAGNWGAFTAQICDNSNAECFTEDGYSSGAGDDSAIYIGIAGSDISSVTFSLTSAASHPGDFAIGEVMLDAPETVTPEPSSLPLFGSGLVALAGALRRKLAR
jgi:hypothetical protein